MNKTQHLLALHGDYSLESETSDKTGITNMVNRETLRKSS